MNKHIFLLGCLLLHTATVCSQPSEENSLKEASAAYNDSVLMYSPIIFEGTTLPEFDLIFKEPKACLGAGICHRVVVTDVLRAPKKTIQVGDTVRVTYYTGAYMKWRYARKNIQNDCPFYHANYRAVYAPSCFFFTKLPMPRILGDSMPVVDMETLLDAPMQFAEPVLELYDPLLPTVLSAGPLYEGLAGTGYYALGVLYYNYSGTGTTKFLRREDFYCYLKNYPDIKLPKDIRRKECSPHKG